MDENLEFLKTQFDTSHTYFIHIENKLSDLLKYYSTLFLAVVSACYYISISDLFKDMRSPSLLITTIVFDFLGLFILYMYIELRTRKIKILEQMAVIREFFSNHKVGNNQNISKLLIMPKSLSECPQYLRRPSEDWYTILYIMILNSMGFSFSTMLVYFIIISKMTELPSLVKSMLILSIPFILFLISWFYLQFKWITIFSYKLDCEREIRHNLTSDYKLFLKVKPSFPWLLSSLDNLATKIESDNKANLERLIKENLKKDE
jgi:hypothetical protein